MNQQINGKKNVIYNLFFSHFGKHLCPDRLHVNIGRCEMNFSSQLFTFDTTSSTIEAKNWVSSGGKKMKCVNWICVSVVV